MTLKEFSLALCECHTPIKVFTKLSEKGREEFASDDALWKRLKEDKALANRKVRWFAVQIDYIKVCLERED